MGLSLGHNVEPYRAINICKKYRGFYFEGSLESYFESLSVLSGKGSVMDGSHIVSISQC